MTAGGKAQWFVEEVLQFGHSVAAVDDGRDFRRTTRR